MVDARNIFWKRSFSIWKMMIWILLFLVKVNDSLDLVCKRSFIFSYPLSQQFFFQNLLYLEQSNNGLKKNRFFIFDIRSRTIYKFEKKN